MAHLRRPVFVLVCSLCLALLPAAAQRSGPMVVNNAHHDASSPLRNMSVSVPHLKDAGIPGEHSEFESFSKPVKIQSWPDTAVQTTVGSPTGAVARLNIAGVGQGDYGYTVVNPAPDANGAVGATQFVQSVASSFAVFDKTTGALVLGPVAVNSLFQGFGGPCETTQAGDSVIQYDKLASRWVIGTMAQRIPTGEGFNYECIAVSQTSDATGSYYRYSINLPGIDYQKIGVWPDAYYLGLNNPANTIATACALDRNAMLSGASAKSVCFTRPGVNTLLPADLDGHTPPPAGSPNYFVGGINTGHNVLNVFKFHADFSNPKASTLTGPTAIAVASYTPSCLADGGYYRSCVPQKGSNIRLETLSDRLMYRNTYRNFSDHETLVINHSVDVAGASGHSVGLRWYELRSVGSGNFTVFQQGTYAPDSSSRWMGSAAMDGAGDIAVGYAVSNSAIYPSMAFTGRQATDPLGTLGAEKIVLKGGSSTTNSLWGDYTSMAIDPVDDCTFWFTSEYYKAGDQQNWSTRIVSLKFQGCK